MRGALVFWLVAFVSLTAAAPVVAAYLVAGILDGFGSGAIGIVLGGGTGITATASAIAAGVALAATLRFTAGSLFDVAFSAMPSTAYLPYTASGYWWMFNSRQLRDPEQAPELGLGLAVGWVGGGVAAILLVGMSIAGWPSIDPTALQHVSAGVADTSSWVAAAFPELARTTIASILGILAGAFWSVEAGPTANT